MLKMNRLLLFFMCITSFTNSSELYSRDLNKSWVIIFLDIDGVLYREPTRDDFWQERHEKIIKMFGKLDRYCSFHYDAATTYYFNQEAVGLLEYFIDYMNLHYHVGIVISSAWREGHTLEELRQIFSPWRFSEFIIDKTVSSSYDGYTKEELQNFSFGYASRADQINHWLQNHSGMNITHFVIFDDQDSGFSKRFPDQFIHIKRYYLSEEDISKAIEAISIQKSGNSTGFNHAPSVCK